MVGESDLDKLVKTLQPSLSNEVFVFCSLQGILADYLHLKPVASFVEAEGLSLIIPEHVAGEYEIEATGLFRCISLTVHSSLEAVGLTAVIANALAEKGISANVVAAFYHDHIFVSADKAEEAMQVLQALGDC